MDKKQTNEKIDSILRRFQEISTEITKEVDNKSKGLPLKIRDAREIMFKDVVLEFEELAWQLFNEKELKLHE